MGRLQVHSVSISSTQREHVGTKVRTRGSVSWAVVILSLAPATYRVGEQNDGHLCMLSCMHKNNGPDLKKDLC